MMQKLGPALCCAAMVATPSPIAAQSQPPLLNQSARAGTWTYVSTPTGSEARFGDAAGPQLLLRCNRAARRVAIGMRSQPVAGLSVTTSSLSRYVAATHDAKSGMAIAELPAADPLFDAVAFSRARFAVTAQGLPPLVLPNWPEAARAIEDCRN